MKIYAFAVLIILFSPSVFGAKCQSSDGNWYPYDDPHCSPSKKEADTTSQKNSLPETADAVMSSGSPAMVKVNTFILLSTSKKIGDAPIEQGTACLDKYRASFKDPHSAYVVAATLYESKVERFLHADVSARNGFGGNDRIDIVCSVPSP
jgi:hypothetical protein